MPAGVKVEKWPAAYVTAMLQVEPEQGYWAGGCVGAANEEGLAKASLVSI